MTISADVQLIDSPHQIFIPGRQICGEVLVTTSKPIEVRAIHVEFKGRLWMDSGYFLEGALPEIDPTLNNSTNSMSIESGIGKMRQPCPNCANADRVRQPSANCISAGRVQKPSANCTVSGRVRQPSANRNIDQDNREFTMTLTTLKTTPTGKYEWKPGLHKVSFAIDIPHEGSVPAIKDSRIRVEYWLKAFVDTPVPLLSYFSWSTKSRALPLQLGERLSDLQIVAAKTPMIKWASISVGVWDQSSSKATALLKYAVGCDTAREWYRFVFELSVPQLISVPVGMPYYLQEGCSITLTPESDVEVDILVRQLEILLVTRVQVTRPEIRGGTLGFSTNILNDKDLPPLVNKGARANVPVNLTPLLSAARLPSSILPSVNCYPLLITHELVVSLKLKAITETNVRQASSSVEIKVPVQINNYVLPADYA